jgi:extracellular elastinolytic metalloproteinase
VLGSPLGTAGTRPQTARLTAAQAHARAMVDAGTGVPVRGTGGAKLVYFAMPGGPQLAWQVRAHKSSTEDYTYLVGARVGNVLWRHNNVDFATGKVWEYYPSDIAACGTGCAQRVVTFPAPWQTQSTKLQGNNAHAFLDLLDDDTPVSGDEIPPSSGTAWNYTFQDFTSTTSNLFAPCDPDWKCSWDAWTSDSWQANRRQDATQVYYYVNKFHDHLLAAPIGFTEAAGNFQQVNSTGKGKPGDPVLANVDDGADTAGGFPDENHIDNANMATPSDGHSPRMQMYLFTDSGFVDGNGGDDASVIYHEYTHGLSNRLIHYADGTSALNGAQGGAMGEAWSDWYAMDYLINQHYDADTATVGDVNVGFFISAGASLIRTEPMDCPVGTSSFNCPGTSGAGSGGYTYGDFGKIIGFPEVHADGEIWGQTIWQLRQQLGATKTEALLTRAMMLSPQSPTFLDMRNAILQADTVLYSNADATKIWQVFANRGMGFFASTLDSGDSHPIQNFSMPPAPGGPTGAVAGTVTDVTTGKPIPEASVQFGGHNSGFAGTNLVGTSNWVGKYSILRVPTGTYP